MSNLIRWEPMRDFLTMRDVIDRLFDDVFARQFGVIREFGYPAMDMYQTENEVVVKATLPGVKAEDLQVSITGDVLTLRGEVKQDSEVKEANYHLKERSFGSFSRSVSLPVPVVADKAKAEFENGVLTLVLPKA
ncbi:MAG: Hsp20/alpha crystallin family protein, partial [Anaerolineales bacterium]